MGALERVSWLLLLLANSLALAKVLEPDRQYDTRSSLEAGVPLQQVELPMSGGQALYELKGLKKQQGYEVKISFPGTVPATYHIELVGEEREDTRAGRRRLLDTEKLVFTTDDSGRPLRGAVPVQAAILVTVQPLGLVSWRSLSSASRAAPGGWRPWLCCPSWRSCWPCPTCQSAGSLGKLHTRYLRQTSQGRAAISGGGQAGTSGEGMWEQG
ncbi:hypothetical protein KFL_002090120 [Klebsormidium nitens]|uniref:Uncharacterized protein n=1 Tax=Klebsormidium nitens TaxID=105231 RepID=A0A1Y1I1R9_KLENI|nr:hypothetical protein KFL_002090120 [Klebsormidium nitens]|eukprot:GAQ84860.1 hypothetical protein KFL_002090120 [Klebsormidium nitens]